MNQLGTEVSLSHARGEVLQVGVAGPHGHGLGFRVQGWALGSLCDCGVENFGVRSEVTLRSVHTQGKEQCAAIKQTAPQPCEAESVIHSKPQAVKCPAELRSRS